MQARRRRGWLGLVVAALSVAMCGGCWDASPSGPSADHRPSPDAAGTDPTARESPIAVACPHGGGPPIAGLRGVALPCLSGPGADVPMSVAGHRPQVLNVWASWCDPCRREAAVVEEAHRSYGDRVAFLGIDCRDDRAAALGFLAESATTYPHVFDPAATVARELGLVGMPSTLFVSASGEIVDRYVGEISAERLRAGLSRLGIAGGPPPSEPG